MWEIHQDNRQVTGVKSALSVIILQQKIELT